MARRLLYLVSCNDTIFRRNIASATIRRYISDHINPYIVELLLWRNSTFDVVSETAFRMPKAILNFGSYFSMGSHLLKAFKNSLKLHNNKVKSSAHSKAHKPKTLTIIITGGHLLNYFKVHKGHSSELGGSYKLYIHSADDAFKNPEIFAKYRNRNNKTDLQKSFVAVYQPTNSYQTIRFKSNI
uniref:Uncharacterized protein n=1 Tax=Glossina austeni TaxID=7395 RepID=A0A1A9UVP8_GLOAU